MRARRPRSQWGTMGSFEGGWTRGSCWRRGCLGLGLLLLGGTSLGSLGSSRSFSLDDLRPPVGELVDELAGHDGGALQHTVKTPLDPNSFSLTRITSWAAPTAGYSTSTFPCGVPYGPAPARSWCPHLRSFASECGNLFAVSQRTYAPRVWRRPLGPIAPEV